MNTIVKQWISGLLLLAMAVGALSGNRCLFDYYTNQAAYLRKCENKNRPQLHCNGRCQLMKKMQQKEKQQQENSKPPIKTDLIQKDRFSERSAECHPCPDRPIYNRYTPALSERAKSIFHPPPQAVS